jgi:DNA polymerase III subunit chi
MGEAYFYHLTRSPLEATLPMLLAKARGAGWRVLVRGREAAHLDWLNDRLWLGAEDGFLAHGLAGGEHDADQPILLTLARGNPNRATCLMAVDGAEVDPGEVGDMARVCILFDGNDAGALESARGQWKALTGAGCAAQYWAQDGGKWVKKAEHSG